MRSTLWISLRIMEERKSLLEKMSRRYLQRRYNRTARNFELRAAELERHINTLKQILTAGDDSPEPGVWQTEEQTG